MKLIKFELPSGINDTGEDFKYAYTHGFYCADGTDCKNKYGKHDYQGRITLYGDKKKLIKEFDIRTSSYKETFSGSINLMMNHDLDKKFKVPINYNKSSKLKWLAGLF